MKGTRVLARLTFLLALVPAGAAGPQTPTRDATSAKGMVVAASSPAARAGAEILKRGGNAVDAAVATAFALAVTYPLGGNIGGGGFMLVYPSDQRRLEVIDYREAAPLSSFPTMLAKGTSHKNHRYVGVPGTVAGLALAHQRWGSLPWADLVAPAIQLAERGFVVGDLAGELNFVVGASSNQELRRVYGRSGGKGAWTVHDTLTNPDRARTLRRISSHGAAEFYTGETADLLVQEMLRGQGVITHEDLTRYRAKVREPVHTTFRGYDVLALRRRVRGA